MALSLLACGGILACAARPASTSTGAKEERAKVVAPSRPRSQPKGSTCTHAALSRREHRVLSTDPGVELLVLSVETPLPRRGVVVFTHGAGSASSASWDIRYGDYSFMRFLACQGFDAYAVDVRGFGGSTLPKEMSQPAEHNPPVVRAADAARDLAAVVGFVRERTKTKRVNLIGWSWGCVVAGLYTTTHADQIKRLVLMSPVYDRRWPRRHRTKGAWRTVTEALFYRHFNPAVEEKAVLDEVVTSLFRFQDSGELRLPNGPYRDLYGPDAPVWDAKKVTVPTLVVRGDKDRASLAPHARALVEHLAHAPVRRYVVMEGAGHFFYRTRNYKKLHNLTAAFLTEHF